MTTTTTDLPTIRKFRKKPVEIEAVQLNSVGDMKRALAWMGSHNASGAVSNLADPYLIVFTLEGNMEAKVGSWLIRGVKGEFYPCDPEIFRMTYEDA
jgi:hypothetical protein